MPLCDELEAGLDPSCLALNKVGGIKPRVWAAQLKNIAGYTVNSTTKAIETVTMKQIPGTSPAEFYPLLQFTGKKDKHLFGVTGVPGENVNTFNHSAALGLFAYSQLESDAVEALFNADDVVVFAQTNADQIKAYGIELGLNGTGFEAPEGAILNDVTMITVTLEGEQIKGARVFQNGTNLADSITYLDAKNGTVA
jgi:hypothetical protein